MSTLLGKRIVIIGGTSGMGRGAAGAARDAGAEVIAAGRSSKEFPVDITSEESIKALFERVGPFDHLLVTATPPGGGRGLFLEQDLASAKSFVDGKLFGSWASARWAAPRLRAGGSITFVTGGASVRPRPGTSIVSAAFAALETLTKGLAIELAPLRVNTIRPGYTDSEMWSFLDDAARAELKKKVSAALPARRMGTVDDIGSAAVFLMSNPQVTGSTLTIDGGETLVDAI